LSAALRKLEATAEIAEFSSTSPTIVISIGAEAMTGTSAAGPNWMNDLEA
jgi:hypothetical protein